MTSALKKDFSGINFVDQQERQFFAEAEMGEETIEFLRSPIGRLLHGRARQVVEQAKTDLLDINPLTRRGFRKFKRIQEEALQAKWFMRWCAETIQDGDIAATQLEFYRSES